VLQAEASDRQIEQWKQDAVRVEYMPSGKARQYLLDVDHQPAILQSHIGSITFIPAVNLDQAIIRARFGQAEKVIRVNDKLVHYLYPSKGVDIALSDDQKDVIQYVQPADFQRLVQPLH